MRKTRITQAAALFAMAAPAVHAADLTSAVALLGNDRLLTVAINAPGTPGVPVKIKGLATGEKVLGIDHRPATGDLYGVTNQNRVLRIGPNGRTFDAVTLSIPLAGTVAGVDFNPVPDRLRIVTSTGQNLRVDVATGATTQDLPLNPGSPHVTAAAYTNAFGGVDTTSLFVIDTATDQLFLQNPPNNGTLTPIGSLGMDASDSSGFDIRASDGRAVAALTVNGVSGLYGIDLATGAATSLGAIGSGEYKGVKGLSIPTPAATVYAISGDRVLVRFPATAPGVSTRVGRITGLASGESIVGLDVRPATGQLYGLGSGGSVYTIDTATAVATLAAALSPDPTDTVDGNPPFSALAGGEFGVDFNPVPDRMRVVSDTGQNLRINVGTGATFTDGSERPLAPAVTAAAYTNSLPGPVGTVLATTLYVIDAASDRLMIQNPPNDGTLADVGALGVAVEGIAGFDIVSADTALAALVPTGSGGSSLYGINLVTGAATLVGPISMGTAVVDIAHPVSTDTPAADSTMYALGVGGTLHAFARNAPGSAALVGTVTGMQPGESLLGIDFRATTGGLYGISSRGNVYALNTSTAAATFVAATSADPADVTSPFGGLSGTSFGVDFNPVPDRLRVVSDANQNLRVNVDTGATTTDTALSRPAPAIVAAAYTNAFPGGKPEGSAALGTTTLYVLDAVENRLAIQNPPNTGTVTPVGSLGLDIPASGVSFDIVGGHNGMALASFDATGDGVPELYRISLSTGAATLLGAISAPLQAVTSIAIRLE